MADERYTLEERLAYATEKRDAAAAAIVRADAVYADAHEMGGGIPGFGGSGSQRAAQKVRATYDRSHRLYNEAKERHDYWDAKAKGYERRIAERDRVRLTREDVANATHVLISRTWRKVVRVNATTVSVETGYSWVDRYPFDQVLDVTVDLGKG
jgi:hypothetical protein